MNPTERQAVYRAYVEAYQCQDACNLSGLAQSLAQATRSLWIEADAFDLGTNHVDRHPAVTLFLAKMLELNGTLIDMDAYSAASRRVGLVRCLGPDGLSTDAHLEALAERIDGPMGVEP